MAEFDVPIKEENFDVLGAVGIELNVDFSVPAGAAVEYGAGDISIEWFDKFENFAGFLPKIAQIFFVFGGVEQSELHPYFVFKFGVVG